MPDTNKLAVLKKINQEYPSTKMDIVRQTDLSLPTVNSILDALIEDGFVSKVGQGRSRGGRPPSLYQFNPKARFVIGIEIKIPTISIGLVDLQENLIGLAEYPFSEEVTAAYVLQTLEDGITSLLANHQVDSTKLVGIGLGVPGYVEQDTGIWLQYLSNPRLKEIPLRSLLSSKFKVPIYIQNELNVCALAELTYGNLQPENDVILITAYEGLKSSIVVDGCILSGYHGNFGTIGHFTVVEEGRPCYCGAKGCLEMYAAGYGFRQVIKSKVNQDRSLSEKYASLEPWDLFKLAADGNSFCRGIIETGIPHMAYAFASLIRMTDIEHVILLGIYVAGGVYLQNLLYDKIGPRLPETVRNNLKIQIGSEHSPETLAVAAALPSIQGFFEPETTTI
jgi:predicted NBD/HSP70 family sugar kinase